MKKVILLTSALFFAFLFIFMACTKENQTKKDATEVAATPSEPVMTKFFAVGNEGNYDLFSDSLSNEIIELTDFELISQANLAYWTNPNGEKQANMLILGMRHGVITAITYDFIVGSDDRIAVPAYVVHTVYTCTSTNCSGCNMIIQNNIPTGCSSCGTSHGICNFNKTVEYQNQPSFSDLWGLLEQLIGGILSI